jgi:hypothetical protein
MTSSPWLEHPHEACDRYRATVEHCSIALVHGHAGVYLLPSGTKERGCRWAKALSLRRQASRCRSRIGLGVAGLPAALLGHLVLGFPDGRMHSRWERLVVGAAYFDALVTQVVMLMFMGFEHVNGCPCPSNLLFVRDDMRLHSAIMTSQRLLGFVLAADAVALLLRRWRAHGGSPQFDAPLFGSSTGFAPIMTARKLAALTATFATTLAATFVPSNSAG